MKRYLSILMAICLILTVTACGQTEASVAQEPEPASSVEQVPVPEETPAPSAPEDSAVENSAIEEPSAAEEEETHPTLAYPLDTDGAVFTMLQAYNPNSSMVFGNDVDYSAAVTYANLAENTGVEIDFQMLSETSFSTQVDLIIASGDTPDLYGRSVGSYDYNLMRAVSDEVVIDILPLVEENAPDLYALMQEDTGWAKKLANSDGTVCKIADYAIPMTTDGPFIRGDWLDALGLEPPTDVDSLTKVLEAFKSEYNCSMPLLLDSDLSSVLDDCFNFMAMGFIGFSFQQDQPNSGHVICSYTSEEYIDYLMTLHDYYTKGLISSDFLSISRIGGNLEAAYIAGDTGVWIDGATYTYQNAAAARDNNPEWKAVPFAIDQSNFHMNMSADSGGVGLATAYISTSCWNPELALQFFNYGFTQEGAMLVQAGVEDLTYTYDSDGKMVYTDVITNNPDGFSSVQATYAYLTSSWMPSRQLPEVLELTYTDEVLAACDVWTSAPKGDDSMVYPMDCFLNEEEQTEVSGLRSDCLSLFSSNVAKVIFGDIDEAGYRDVIAQANSYGLDRITEIYQAAFDRYQAEQE